MLVYLKGSDEDEKTNTAYFVDRLNTYPHCARCFYIVKCGHPQSKATIKARESGHNCSKNQKEVIHYTAIGDSLTEGIGDLTNSGGFVPIVADDLKNTTTNGVQTDNFGKMGIVVIKF